MMMGNSTLPVPPQKTICTAGDFWALFPPTRRTKPAPRPNGDPMKPKLLVPFALGHFANDIAPVGMYLIIPAFGLAMGLSPVEIGLLFTIHSFGSAMAHVPAGILIDHVSNRGFPLIVTFFWVALGYFGASLVSDYWTFALLIAVAGAGDAAWHPMATGILARVHKDRKAYALGVHALGGHFSEVVALLVAGYLISIADWRVALQALILPGLVMGFVFIGIARRVPRIEAARPQKADFARLWRVWTSRMALRVILLFSAYNMALFATSTMTPVFLKSVHDLDWQETALAMAAMMALGALVQPSMGRISDVIGRRPLLIAGNALAAVGAVAAWLAPSLVAVLIALGIVLTTLVAIRAVVLAVALDHGGEQEGASLGLAFVFLDGIGALGAVLAGLIGERDLSQAFLFAGLLSAVAAGLSVLPRRFSTGRSAHGETVAEPGD